MASRCRPRRSPRRRGRSGRSVPPRRARPSSPRCGGRAGRAAREHCRPRPPRAAPRRSSRGRRGSSRRSRRQRDRRRGDSSGTSKGTIWQRSAIARASTSASAVVPAIAAGAPVRSVTPSGTVCSGCSEKQCGAGRRWPRRGRVERPRAARVADEAEAGGRPPPPRQAAPISLSGTQRSDDLGSTQPSASSRPSEPSFGAGGEEGPEDAAAHATGADQRDRGRRGGVRVSGAASVPVPGRDTRRSSLLVRGRPGRIGPPPAGMAAAGRPRMIAAAHGPIRAPVYDQASMPIYEFECGECGERFEELVAGRHRAGGLPVLRRRTAPAAGSRRSG